MTRTVVGVFDRYESVESAERALHDAGFSDSQIRITEQPNGRDNASGTQDEGMLSGVRRFFADLFGDNDSDRDAAQYAQAMRMGWTVVKVDADEDRVSAAALALEQAGAVDIDAKADEWRADGWNEGLATPAAVHNQTNEAPGKVTYPAPAPASVNTGGVRVYSRLVERPVNESVETEQAGLHRRPVDRPVTAADPDALSRSARLVEDVSIGESVRSNTEQVRDALHSTADQVEQQSGDDSYRQHFMSRYGDTARYEDYAPAYQYGAMLRDDPRYAGRDWDSFESDVRADWQGRHPGSGWERFKEAVRHAWQGARH